MDHTARTRFIEANLPLEPVAFVPEIRLHQAIPASGLGRLAAADDAFTTPYWAYAWTGGLALARFLLDRPACVAGKAVLDLGCGSGLVAIAAAKAGAASVKAVDVDPYAAAATRLNARANGVDMDVANEDLTRAASLDAELVLVGDLFYDFDLAAGVTSCLDRWSALGTQILIGDPWRRGLPRGRLRTLANYEIAERSGGEPKKTSVFEFRCPPPDREAAIAKCDRQILTA